MQKHLHPHTPLVLYARVFGRRDAGLSVSFQWKALKD